MNFTRKNINHLAFAFAYCVSLFGCEKYPDAAVDTGERINLQAIYSVTQQDIDKIAKNLLVHYRVVSNIPSPKCTQLNDNGTCFEIELSFIAKQAIAAKDWLIYFSQITPIQSAESKDFSVKHINGDIHQISLKDNFSGFAAGEKKTLKFNASFLPLARSEAMPNYIVSAPNLEARIIESTQPITDKYTGLEVLPHVEFFSDKGSQISTPLSSEKKWLANEKLAQRNASDIDDKISVIQAIIPTPTSVQADKSIGFADVSQGIAISLGNVLHSDVSAAISRLDSLGVSHNPRGIPLHMSIVNNAEKKVGHYNLAITEKDITIIGVDANGVFNGLQSIASLISLGELRIPLMTVVDEPYYAFRGLSIDVTSNFHSKEIILRLLEQMSAYKLNKLQLNLGGDEGWRIDIPSLPELTEVGARRCFDVSEATCLMPQLGAGIDGNSSVNGFYSVSDYQEILRVASARHIQVIPSMTMPRHARAAIKAMTARYKKFQTLGDEDKAKQFLLVDLENDKNRSRYLSTNFYHDNAVNPCLNSSYSFALEVMTQLKRIHASAEHPLTHYKMGVNQTNDTADWLTSSSCKSFVSNNNIVKVSELDAYFNKRISSILSSLDINLLENTNIASFDFSLPYEVVSKESSTNWNTHHTNTEQIFKFKPDKNTSGIQGQVNSKSVRTDTMLAHQIFPRLFSLAERAWHFVDEIETEHSSISALNRLRDKQWSNFANSLGQKEFAKLELAQIDYRIPTVAAAIREGKLHANIAFPNLTIEYQVKDMDWQTYQEPTSVSGKVYLRSRNIDGSRTSRLTYVQGN